MIVHPDSLPIALEAAHKAGLPSGCIVLFDVKGSITDEMYKNHETIGSVLELIEKQNEI